MARLICSHINAETPGCIHEGGELGYALSVSFGAVMDKPDLIVACVVGDGEAETGPTATYVIVSLVESISAENITIIVLGMVLSISTPPSLVQSFQLYM
jgi:phosphoketolase